MSTIVAKISAIIIQDEKTFSDAAIRAYAYLASSRQSEKFKVSLATFKAVFGWSKYRARQAINQLLKTGTLVRNPAFDSKGRFYFEYQLTQTAGKPFVRLSADVIRNGELSDAAFRAYAFMVSVAGATYRLTAQTFKAVFNWGREKHRQAIACLKENGLLAIRQTHGKSGEFAYDYELSTSAGTTIAGSTSAGFSAPLKLDQEKFDQSKLDQIKNCVWAHDFYEIDEERDSPEASKDSRCAGIPEVVFPQSEDPSQEECSAGGAVEFLAQIAALGIIADAGVVALVSKCKERAADAIAATRQALQKGWLKNPPIAFLKAALKDGYKPQEVNIVKSASPDGYEILQTGTGMVRVPKEAPGGRVVNLDPQLIGRPGGHAFNKMRAASYAIGERYEDHPWLNEQGEIWDSFLEYQAKDEYYVKKFNGNIYKAIAHIKKGYRRNPFDLQDDWEAYEKYWAARMGTLTLHMDQYAQIPCEQEREKLAAHAPAFRRQSLDTQKQYLAKALSLSPERTLLLTEQDVETLLSELKISLDKAMKHISSVDFDAAIKAGLPIKKFLDAGEGEAPGGLLPPAKQSPEDLQKEIERRDAAINTINGYLEMGELEVARNLVANHPRKWNLSIEDGQLVAGEFGSAGTPAPTQQPTRHNFAKQPTLEWVQAKYNDPTFSRFIERDIKLNNWDFEIVDGQVIEKIDDSSKPKMLEESAQKRPSLEALNDLYGKCAPAVRVQLKANPQWNYEVVDGCVVIAGIEDELGF